jgi:hypothetical protein
MFALNHGAQIWKQSNHIMGTKQFKTASTWTGSSHSWQQSRTLWMKTGLPWYREYLKKKIIFITIGQDIWDSKQKEALGVTAFWYSPTRKKYYIFPVGLEVVEDKSWDCVVSRSQTFIMLLTAPQIHL